MFRSVFKKKRIAFIAGVAAVAVTGIAVAYFTGGSGSVKAPGTVGASAPWAVTTGTPTWSGTLTALYPGATNNTELIPFTVTNNGNGNQSVRSITVTVPQDANGFAETTSGASITSCNAAGFKATLDAANTALPVTVPAGGTYTGKIDLIMQDDGSNQNTCQNASPAVLITAS